MLYLLEGVVILGKGYGRKLGFPTVNLEVQKENIPEPGVYAGEAVLQEEKYKAGIVISPEGKVEAHLIGYKGDAYGKTVLLVVGKFLREFRNFPTEEELIAQIKKDISQC